jgi:regulator of sigma E protease
METIYSLLQQGFFVVVPFIVLLGLLVFVHELGHFAVAKWCGVRVEIFSLGFGKKIFSFKKGDTTYCISLIPLGGYVKMFGDEQGAQVDPQQKQYSFLHKKVSQRIAIVLAGPLMNFFFAIFIFAIIAIVGEEVRSPQLGDIEKDSLAYNAGFRSGDFLKTVQNEKVDYWDEFQKKVSIGHDQLLKFTVIREGTTQEVELKATPKLVPNPNILSLDSMVGDIEGLSFLSRASFVGVRESSQALKVGLKTGDKITKINGQEIKYFRQIEPALIPFQNQQVSIEIERGSEKSSEVISLNPKFDSFASLAGLGIESPDLFLDKIQPDSPAAVAGLKPFDRIIEINGTTPNRWEDVLQSIKSYSGEGAVALKIERGPDVLDFSIVPRMTSQMTHQGAEEKRYTIGIVPLVKLAPPATMVRDSSGVLSSMARGFQKTIDITAMTVVSFLRLIQNEISPKNIGGVISIGQAASESFKIGIHQFLQMMAILSVHLFILNLLPIPVLDGGHLLFYSIEALRGAPLSMRKMEIAQQVGLVLLMSLMAYALFNDFSRLLGFW